MTKKDNSQVVNQFMDKPSSISAKYRNIIPFILSHNEILISSLSKFYGRSGIKQYEVSLSRMLNEIL